MHKTSEVYREEMIPKHRDLIIFYHLLIKHLGEKARHMQRQEIYRIVGAAFYIEPGMVTRIISRMARQRVKPNRAEIAEFKDKIKLINKVCEQIIT